MAAHFIVKRSVLVLALICLFQITFAQDYKKITARIDSFANVKLPKSALAEVDKLDNKARKENNAAMQVRAALYRMTFQSLIEENALVAIISRLKQDIKQADYPVKPVLQSVLANMYWSYYQQNRWQFAQRTKLEKPDTDFTKWDLETINQEISRNFKLSLHDYQREQQTPVSVLNGVLLGDKSTRYLRPTLYDMLVQRAFVFFLSDEGGVNKPKNAFILTNPQLFNDSRTFAGLNISTSDTSAAFYQGIQYLQQATLFHLQADDKEPLADIDLKRLEFLQTHAEVPDKDSLYLKALRQIETTFAAQPISADAWVLEGKYWYDQSKLKNALTYFNKAVESYPKSHGGENAADYIKMIQQKHLQATLENVNMPDKPLLGLFTYRNVKTAHVVIYKISATQYNELAKIPSDINRYNNGLTIYASDSVFKYLHKLNPVKDEKIELPDPQDYVQHNTEFKIDPLKTGHYVLTIRDDQSDDPTLIGLTAFKVCKLAYVTRHNPDGGIEVRVMDRATGVPLPGVQVTVAESETKITDINGRCPMSDRSGNFSVKLTTATDTLYTASNYSYNPPAIHTTTNTILFTDRQIYRPGQTIYFKGLHLQTQDGKSILLPNTKQTVNIKDNNQKTLISMPVVTNEFGTFSGTYTLPQNILNRVIDIDAGDGQKPVRVEEYKRPSFQVSFLPVTDGYKPNDSVTITGKVTAYSGYGLSQARVAYRVMRSAYLTDYRKYQLYHDYLNVDNGFKIDTINTDDQGLFKIKFKAAIQAGADLHALNYRFAITADVTDGSGETRSADANVQVSVNNITVTANVPQRVLATDSIRIQAGIHNLDGAKQNGVLQLQVYALQAPGRLFKRKVWYEKVDQHLMSKDEYHKFFPDYDYDDEENELDWPVKNKITDLTMNADKRQEVTFNLDILKKQPTGNYKIVIEGKNQQGDTISIQRYLYVINEPAKPQRMTDWVTPLVTLVDPGTPAQFLVGTGTPAHVLMEKYQDNKMLSAEWLNIPAGKQQLIKIPIAGDEKSLSIQFLMITGNRVYTSTQVITNKKNNEHLDIRFLTFRDKLQPGEKEEWKLQISNKNNEQQAAEMVADLYDASLDDIGGSDYWGNALNVTNRYMPRYFNWGNQLAIQTITNPLKNSNYYFGGMASRNYEYLNLFGYNYYGGYNYRYHLLLSKDKVEFYKTDTVEYRANAYGVAMRQDLVGAVSNDLNEVRIDEPVGNSMPIMIRGASSLQQQPKLPEDVLKNVQMIDDYGDQGQREMKGDPGVGINIETRKNFAETAFFYPQLQTNEKGEILIDFTIPESLTKWHFKAFAHTKDLKTGYIEQEIVTQKQLSINANMPRFLREGDTITVSARLANLTAAALKGRVNLQLFNGVNMQPVNLLLNPADAQQNFDIVASTTKPVSFRLVIPVGLDALTYKLTADAGQFTDGEENTLPVLPNRMLVTESMPMMVRPGQSRTYNFDKLINQKSTTLKSKTLTLEYTQNPAWYAVQSLPYMMEFPYECSEQVFSRYYANSLATSLVSKMPVIKQVFDQWKASDSPELLSNLEKNQELKATLIEETPWLRDAESESEQKKRIALLFDLNKMSYELQQNLDKLQKRQLPDGGFPWFGGDKSDRYITSHILEGMGQLYHLGITDTKNEELKDIADKAMQYLDNQLIDDANWEKKQDTYEGRLISSTEIYSYYTQSYFTARTMSAEMKALTANYLQHAEKQWTHLGVYEEGMIALTMLRNNKPDVARAIVKSLLETAQQSDEMGMYWAKNQLGWFWYQSPVETQSLLIGLFTEVGNTDRAVAEMKIWLLRNKQTTNWKTTKATAAACYALLLKGDDWLAGQPAPEIKLGGKDLSELKPDIKADAGSGYIKTVWTDEQIKPALGKVTIKNNGKVINWGAMHWQYLENLDKITPSTTDITLQRKYFIVKRTDAGEVLTSVDAMHQPKTGDLLKVVVYLKAGRDYEYVQLKDMRPAGTEPVDVLSTYKYQDGLFYYEVTKDVATNFFISTLPKGNYVFEYRLRVAQPGNFSTGITSVQSMYAPEFNAHSEGMRMVVK